MSIKAMVRIWESGLPRDQKYIALALADWANEDGGNFYPSVGHIAHKTEYSDSQVKAILRALRTEGKIVLDGQSRWGTNIYHFDWAKIPKKAPYKAPKRGRPTNAEGAKLNGVGNKPSLSGKNGSGIHPNIDENRPQSVIQSDSEPSLNTLAKLPASDWLFLGEGREVKNPGALKAMQANAARVARGQAGFDLSEYPEDAAQVLGWWLSYWPIEPPSKRQKSQFALWIKEARELGKACDLYGQEAIKAVFEDWQADTKNGRPPYTISRPGAITNTVKAKVAQLRIEAPEPEGTTDTVQALAEREAQRQEAAEIIRQARERSQNV